MKKPLRKEVYLTEQVVEALNKKAVKQKRSLKNYMEQVLIKDAEK